MRLLHSFILSICLLSTVILLNILQDRYYADQHTAKVIIETKQTKQSYNTIATPIIFHNNIAKKNLGYKHWTGTYYPTTFALRINDVLLEPNSETTIDIIDKQCTVRIDYSFVSGRRNGGIIATYQIDETLPVHACNFISWIDDERLTITGAHYMHHEKSDFDNSVKGIRCHQ